MLTNYQHDFDEEAGFAAVRHLYDLARQPSDERPFFLVASFTHPHDPYEARPEWWTLYDPEDIDLPEPIADHEIDAHTRRIRHGIGSDTPGYTDEQCRNARHGYYANTSYFDSWLGRLVRALEETGRARRHNRDRPQRSRRHARRPGAFFKMSFFERAARVPLVVAGPGVAICAIPNVCSLVDLLPTISTSTARVTRPCSTTTRPTRDVAGEYVRDGMDWLTTGRRSRIIASG